MADLKIGDNVREFATVGFILLGVLFGMMIMNFIFTQLGTDFLDADTITSTNIPGAYINETTYTISEASNVNFNGGFNVVSAVNSSDGVLILSGNYTVNAASGTLVNASVLVWSDVNLTYTFSQKTDAQESSEDIQNNSLQAIVTYTEQSDTQFSTIAIAITLVILIAVFLIFWRVFVSQKKKKSKSSGGNFA